MGGGVNAASDFNRSAHVRRLPETAVRQTRAAIHLPGCNGAACQILPWRMAHPDDRGLRPEIRLACRLREQPWH